LIIDLIVFANEVRIPPQRFSEYNQKNNPRNIGDGNQGKKKSITINDILFACCILACGDHGNDGLLSKEAVNMIQELLLVVLCISA
jgi:hypothetical protein